MGPPLLSSFFESFPDLKKKIIIWEKNCLMPKHFCIPCGGEVPQKHHRSGHVTTKLRPFCRMPLCSCRKHRWTVTQELHDPSVGIWGTIHIYRPAFPPPEDGAKQNTAFLNLKGTVFLESGTVRRQRRRKTHGHTSL